MTLKRSGGLQRLNHVVANGKHANVRTNTLCHEKKICARTAETNEKHQQNGNTVSARHFGH